MSHPLLPERDAEDIAQGEFTIERVVAQWQASTLVLFSANVNTLASLLTKPDILAWAASATA